MKLMFNGADAIVGDGAAIISGSYNWSNTVREQFETITRMKGGYIFYVIVLLSLWRHNCWWGLFY
jgi:hypothetical protein